MKRVFPPRTDRLDFLFDLSSRATVRFARQSSRDLLLRARNNNIQDGIRFRIYRDTVLCKRAVVNMKTLRLHFFFIVSFRSFLRRIAGQLIIECYFERDVFRFIGIVENA